MTSSFTHFVLLASLFYYIGKGLLPTVITGKTMYPIIFGAASLAFIVKIAAMGRLISRSMNFAVILFGAGTYGLYLALTLMDDSRRFETSFTQYFGIFPFILLFYALFSFSKFDPYRMVKVFLTILSLEAMAEFVMVNIFGLTKYMVHYDTTELWARKALVEVGGKDRIIGLLGNTSNTAVFMVTIFYLYLALRPPGRLKSDPLLYLFILGFLACFSGTGFAALLLPLIFYSLSSFTWMTVIIIPLILGLGNLIGSMYEYAYKISFTYISLFFFLMMGQVQEFLEHVSDHPLLLIFGSLSKWDWAASDIAWLKAITDFGLAPLLLYLYLILTFLRNVKKMGLPIRSTRLIRVSMLSLVLGTLHYPAIFSFPVQALLAALVAYSMYARREKTSFNLSDSKQALTRFRSFRLRVE